MLFAYYERATIAQLYLPVSIKSYTKGSDAMLENLLQLIILFLVIFDPFASFAVFYVATSNMDKRERNKTAAWALLVAGVLSYGVLFFGQNLLNLFSTTIEDFKVAGGIILVLLGINMALGYSLTNIDKIKNNSAIAIAAIIGTPMLTGPAAITSIIVSVKDYGIIISGAAVTIVLAFTGILFYSNSRLSKFMGRTAIQVMSTILGLVTVAWGVKFVRAGLGI